MIQDNKEYKYIIYLKSKFNDKFLLIDDVSELHQYLNNDKYKEFSEMKYCYAPVYLIKEYREDLERILKHFPEKFANFEYVQEDRLIMMDR